LGEAAILQDYPDNVYALLVAVEPRHFWFRARNRVIAATLRAALGELRGRTVLDVGCGTGGVLAALEQAGMHGCGLDMHLVGLRHARRRTRGPLVCETATRIPFSAQFDAVLLCDVIEHTADDSDVLREASRALAPGGSLLVTVPAHPKLWSVVDEVSGHKRRYTQQMLVSAMQQAGLRVRLLRYFNGLLWPAQVLQRRRYRGPAPASPETRLDILRQALQIPPAPINALLHFALVADPLLTRLNVGTSLIALGQAAP
jgi:SAM-dependent methyltransferase